MRGQFEELLAELGRVVHLDLHVDNSGACSILIPPQLVIQLQLDSGQEKLFLFCKIAEIPPGKFRENILKDGLKANAQPDPVPGIVAYLSPTNHLVLYQHYPITILNGETLATLFVNFVQLAESWQTALSQGLSGPMASSPPPSVEKPFGLK